MFRQLAPRGSERGRPVPTERLSTVLLRVLRHTATKSGLIWVGYAYSCVRLF